jgi:integrase
MKRKQHPKLPPYVQGFQDRAGNWFYYFRKPGVPRVRLPGLPWTPTFMAAYEAAAKSETTPIAVGADRVAAGSLDALAVAYFASKQFLSLKLSSQKSERNRIEQLRTAAGTKMVSGLRRSDVERMMAARAETPAAANNMLRAMRQLMKHAVIHGWRRDNPTDYVDPIRSHTGGFHTWSEEEIATFEARHPIGTKARLAFALLLFTAQRRSDVVRMGRQHIKDGILAIRQQKTGTLVEIPLLQELREAIDAAPCGDLTFLVTEFGKGFTAAGFGNWFRDRCNEAGLPIGCGAHGLRKAAARRLAEAGCTAHEIMSFTGHKSLKEVTRYTVAADRKRLAKTAMAKLIVKQDQAGLTNSDKTSGNSKG